MLTLSNSYLTTGFDTLSRWVGLPRLAIQAAGAFLGGRVAFSRLSDSSRYEPAQHQQAQSIMVAMQDLSVQMQELQAAIREKKGRDLQQVLKEKQALPEYPIQKTYLANPRHKLGEKERPELKVGSERAIDRLRAHHLGVREVAAQAAMQDVDYQKITSLAEEAMRSLQQDCEALKKATSDYLKDYRTTAFERGVNLTLDGAAVGAGVLAAQSLIS